VTRHNTVEEFDPVRNQWSDLPSMTTRRSDLAVVAHQGKVYAIGGFTGEVPLFKRFFTFFIKY
jgi:kelch-like protein 18